MAIFLKSVDNRFELPCMCGTFIPLIAPFLLCYIASRPAALYQYNLLCSVFVFLTIKWTGSVVSINHLFVIWHPWTAPSKSKDRLSMLSSVRELVSVQPDSGVADPWATITWPGAEVACGLSLSLADCAFMLEDRDSCIFELPWLLPGIVTSSSSGLVSRYWEWMAASHTFSCFPWGNLYNAWQAHTVDGHRPRAVHRTYLLWDAIVWHTHGVTGPS